MTIRIYAWKKTADGKKSINEHVLADLETRFNKVPKFAEQAMKKKGTPEVIVKTVIS